MPFEILEPCTAETIEIEELAFAHQTILRDPYLSDTLSVDLIYVFKIKFTDATYFDTDAPPIDILYGVD